MLGVSFFLKMYYLRTLLMAYFYAIPFALFSFSYARYTCPNPPAPIIFSTSKLSLVIDLGGGYICYMTSVTSYSIFELLFADLEPKNCGKGVGGLSPRFSD
jgi:hypothetical protein